MVFINEKAGRASYKICTNWGTRFWDTQKYYLFKRKQFRSLTSNCMHTCSQGSATRERRESQKKEDPRMRTARKVAKWKLSRPMQNNHNSIHVQTCTCILAIQRCMGNLSSFWAPLWFFHDAFFATLFADIHLGVLDMFIWAYFELDLEPSPLEFELSHAKQHT